MGIEVVPEDVRVSGRNLRGAADQVAALTPHRDLEPVGAALPGSHSAAAAMRLLDVWAQSFPNWARAVQVHGRRLVSAADDYDAVEQWVVSLLDDQAPEAGAAPRSWRRGGLPDEVL